MEVLKYRKDANSPWQSIVALKGEPGKDGTMTFEDLTEEQRESLRGPQGIQGEPGKDGANGADGKDGYTPVKGVDYFDGQDGAPGKDGEKGEQGIQGPQGEPGKDGEDYILTEADKTEIANLVLAAIPSSEGVNY